jgi:hypothetical protein
MVVMDSIVENSLIVSRASNLCEDLVEEENVSLDESLEQLVQGAKGTHQRRKKSYDRSKVRRSTRIKIKKNLA